MKNFIFYKWLYLIAAIIVSGSFTACSDDDNESNTTPVFPQKQTISCNAGESKDFTFDANTNWTLASSEIWCSIEKDGETDYIQSGTAGTQSVKLHVSDDAQSNDQMDIAKLSLTMGGETIVIGEIQRSAKGYTLEVFDIDGNPIDAIEVGYGTFNQFKVKANYRFAVTNLPSWVKLDGDYLVGSINTEVTGGVRIVEDGNVEKYPVTEAEGYYITFTDDEGNPKASKSIPLKYAGMSPTAMAFTGPTSNYWGWNVSLDGKTFIQETSSSSGTGSSSGKVTYKNRLSFTVKSLSDDYVVVLMEQWKDFQGNAHISPQEGGFEWLHFEKNKGNLSITADAMDTSLGTTERIGYVLAFPLATYNEIANDLEGNLVEDGAIKYIYEQNNLLAEITQKEEKQETVQEFKVTYYNADWMTVEAECTASTDPNNFDIYGTDIVYTLPQPETSMGFNVDPLLDGSIGMDWYFDARIGETQLPTEDVSVEAYTETEINVWISGDLTEDLVIRFTDLEGMETKKVLIITPRY